MTSTVYGVRFEVGDRVSTAGIAGTVVRTDGNWQPSTVLVDVGSGRRWYRARLLHIA